MLKTNFCFFGNIKIAFWSFFCISFPVKKLSSSIFSAKSFSIDCIGRKKTLLFLFKKVTDSLKPIYKGGKIRNYAINKPLPAGLTIDSTTGIITGTPTAILSKTSFIVTGSNTAGSISSTLVITVASMPITPTVKNARYIVGKSGLPSDIRSLVNPLPSGIVPAWYNDTTKIWTTIAPKTKTIIGKYIYQVKAYDTTNQIYSTSYVNDTLIIAPDLPNAFDSTYLFGIKTNPVNISVQVSGLTGANYNFYYNGIKLSSTPLLSNISGNKKYAVSQSINNVESDTVNFNVTVLDPNNLIHLQKIVDSGVLQSNLSYNFTFKFIVTNLTDLRL